MFEPVLLKSCQRDHTLALEAYRETGGYQGLERAVKELSPAEVRQIVLDSGLRGRGGAGFPTGRKWSSVREDAPHPRYVVVNTDEMEPGTFKDRVLVGCNPHLCIEGTILAGYAIGAQQGVFFIRPSYEDVAQILTREIERARREGLVGPNILGSDFSLELIVHRSGGRYICGEGSAQLRAVQGYRPRPQKGVLSTTAGLWGLPTLGNNVETLACAPAILRNGPEWFKNLACCPTGAGTKLYGVSGHVENPGCYELPMGTTLRDLIFKYGGGVKGGGQYKACLPGGASTRFLTADLLDTRLDFDPMKEVGHRMGTGAVIVFDQATCLVAATINLLRFFVRESCGWCTPCRDGLPFILHLLELIEAGQGTEEHIEMIRRMAKHMNHSYCAFAPGAASPVESLLTCFEDEVRQHVSQGRCPFKGV